LRDKDSPGNDEKVIRGILQYLVEHPDANDTCEGILKWWRPKDISEWGKEDVQKALDFLTSKGWLTERKTTRLKKKGDLAYTTTLLPGEKVRLFSTDRRSRFTFDKETKVSYRHAQASEDQFYMASMGREMSDLTITKQGESSSHSWGDWGADMDSQYVSIGFAGAGGGSIDGHYDDQSTKSFLQSLKSHAESAHFRSEIATRTSSSISVGEVSSRTHIESESEDHFESASRVFSNPNRCHAVTFFFYRIHREQTLKVSLVAVERRVKDPAAPTEVRSRQPLPPTGVSVMPNSVLGTASDRLEVESRAIPLPACPTPSPGRC